MKTIRLALVGFGNVGRAFVRLVMKKNAALKEQYGLVFIFTGIATGRHGMAIDPQGLSPEKALVRVEGGGTLEGLATLPQPASMLDFIRSCPADVMLENTPVNQYTGQPAIDHLRTALETGKHAITANKGPVVHGFEELNRAADTNGKCFRYESTVMDGAPIFSLFRSALPCAELLGFTGILNSCTNMILGKMEGGESLEQAIAYAQFIGIAETDPSADIDGWDAAVKVSALCTALMGVPLKPLEIDRTGIRAITPVMVAEALQAGERWKLVCSARREGSMVKAHIGPQRVSPASPMYSVSGTSSFIQFEMDVLPALGIIEGNPGPETTAYGLLADLLSIYLPATRAIQP